MYQVRSIEWEGHGPDGGGAFSERPAVYLSLISTASDTTETVSASLGQDPHGIMRELYHELAGVYGSTPQQIAKMVRFKQNLKKEADGWKVAHRIEVGGNGQPHKIDIQPHDLESAIRSMVNAFNLAVSQSRNPTH